MNSATECLERARAWAESEPRLAAALVYGSVARGSASDYSDLDLELVARAGQRESLWDERVAIAERILDGDVAWSWELPWQRPFRYQAWRDDLAMVDLTFDEGGAEVWEGIAAGFDVLVDREGVAHRLRATMAAWSPPPFDAGASDEGVWPLLSWLAGRVEQGAYWFVRTSLHEALTRRVLPLLGAAAHNADQVLSRNDLLALNNAAPRSPEPEELRRALRETVRLYDLALDRWAERTGTERPRHPLAPAIKKRILG